MYWLRKPRKEVWFVCQQLAVAVAMAVAEKVAAAAAAAAVGY
jgi:hypothetical protein